MKIQTIQHRINRFAPRFIAICGALLMGVASSQAMAQSPLLNYLSASSGGQAGYANSGVRQVNHQGQNYRVINANAVKTAGDPSGGASYAAESSVVGDLPVQQTSMLAHGGSACSSGACSGSCGGRCGNYSAYSMGGYAGAMACGTCEPYCYGLVEWLYMEPDRASRISYSPQYRLPEFDEDGAPRITIGTLPDCVHGYEATWTGVFNWDRSIVFREPTNSLNSFFEARGFPNPVDLTGFEAGSVQTQSWNAEYWSIEANKTLVGWDVAKLLIGTRYIDYDEVYSFTSRSIPRDQFGVMRSEVENKMVGLQGGLDLLYPVGRFAYIDFRSRAGIFLNFADARALVASNGTNIVNTDVDDEDIAGVFDLGTGYRYQVGEILAIRGGVEIMYLTGVASSPNQVRSILTPRTGSEVHMNEDFFVYGLSVGAELRY